MSDKISIVVPVYQVEKYVGECIESICNQTYTNLEIILEDDGSEDNSGKICDKYAKKDSRITVIHKENGGLSDARNSGIKIATGKYICFIDSDDKISELYVEELYKIIIKNNLKIVACNFQKVKNDSDIKYKYDGKIKIYTKEEALKESYNYNSGLPFIVAWNKMYLRELFQNISYPVGKINEDEFTTYKLIYKANKIAYTTAEYYYYFQRENDSIMRKNYNIKRLDIIEAYEERLKFYRNNKEDELYDITFQNYCYTLNIHYACCKLYLKNKKMCNKILEKIRKNCKEFIKNKKVPLKSKVSYKITCIFPQILSIRFKKYLDGLFAKGV